jgi:hypothetical protein
MRAPTSKQWLEELELRLHRVETDIERIKSATRDCMKYYKDSINEQQEINNKVSENFILLAEHTKLISLDRADS